MTTTSTPPTPHSHPKLAETGVEVHPSWVSVRFNKSSWSPPGAQLVGSDIRHQHVVTLQVHTMSRKRDLHQTWWHEDKALLEVHMSEAQFAAAITSFGDGSARPATLNFFASGGEGSVPQCADVRPGEIAQSIAEVRSATTDASEKARAALAEVERLLDEGAGKRALRDAVSYAKSTVDNLPANMAFTAKQMAETVEKVVTKATHDIEAIVELRAKAVGLEIEAYPIVQQLMTGEEQ